MGLPAEDIGIAAPPLPDGVRIFTFHQANIPAAVVDAQATVFATLALPLVQVLTTQTHAAAVDEYLASQPFDVAILFDIDCIPLSRNAVLEAIDIVTSARCLYGASQNANHLPDTADYVAPAFLCMSSATFTQLGTPSFVATPRGDVAAELTLRARETGVEVSMLPVSHVQRPMWRLADGTMYGHGTTYGDRVFHAFEARHAIGARRRFIDKCRDVIAAHEALPLAAAPCP